MSDDTTNNNNDTKLNRNTSITIGLMLTALGLIGGGSYWVGSTVTSLQYEISAEESARKNQDNIFIEKNEGFVKWNQNLEELLKRMSILIEEHDDRLDKLENDK